jgi:predicted transcriptional regulator
MDSNAGLLKFVMDRLPEPGAEGFIERLEEIAKGAEVPFHTLLKIAKGETHDPRVSTVENLLRYFREREAA